MSDEGARSHVLPFERSAADDAAGGIRLAPWTGVRIVSLTLLSFKHEAATPYAVVRNLMVALDRREPGL